MKLSLVLVSELVFYLLKNEWNVEEYWLVVDGMTETLGISTEEENSTGKKWKSFRSNVGKKEDTLENETAMLIEKESDLIYIFKIRLISMHEYLYKYAMVIWNYITWWFSQINDIPWCICI